MRILKIFLLVFILSITMFAQSNYLLYKEKILLNHFATHTTDDPAELIKLQLNKIIKNIAHDKTIQENYLIDSLITEFASGGQYKFLFEYDFYDKIIERTGYLNSNGDWQIFDKDEYFYDTFNNLIREIYFDWNNVNWDSSLQILYEYNQDQKLISTTLQTYLINIWENEVRTSYYYDQAGNETSSLTELWQNNQWNDDHMVYSYYSPQTRKDSILIQMWDGNDWLNYSRSSFYYDSLTTFLELIIAQLWTGNKFQDYLKLNLTNDQIGNQIQQLEEIWNGNVWVNDVKRDYTYIWNYFESGYSELWNGNNWEPGDSPIIVDNPDGLSIAFISQSVHIFYIIVNVELGNSNTPNDFSLSQNYPNPFNPVTKIKYSIPSVTLRQAQSDILVTLKVYDLLGREVATLVNEEKLAGEYEVEFNAANLPSGIYFYQLKAGQYTETKKMILLK